MIDELHIAGVGVIEDATVRLSPGLTVVTGETGAGKTLVVTALEQLLGARADTGLVRAGEEVARLEARVVPPPPEAGEWLDPGSDELVVSREIPPAGRSRARLNGRLATVGALGQVLGSTVEVHGQHTHLRLGQPQVQRDLLDRFAGRAHQQVVEDYRGVHRQWQQAAEALARLEDDARQRARELDRLRFEVEEIEAAGPEPGEDADLERELGVLEHAEELRRAAAEAAAALGDGGARDPLGVAVDALRRVDVEDGDLADLRNRAEALAAEAGELARDVRRYGEGMEADPARLEALRDRRRALNGLTRKYGPELAEVVSYAEEARRRLAELEGADVEAGQLVERVGGLEAELTRLAGDLHDGRRAAGQELTRVVEGHLRDLGMPHARFLVRVGSRERPGPHGADTVTFLLAPNPGEPPATLRDAASGGERSRVALAVEVALADVHDARVVVFDEVDAGVGGATAMAVGEKLARLARGRQVLCVTHLAQIAAFADVHHLIEKEVVGGRTVTTVRRVAEEDRVAELSRMLSGDPGRAEARDHARALLEDARGRLAG